MMFCCWLTPFESEGRDGPGCGGAHRRQQQTGTISCPQPHIRGVPALPWPALALGDSHHPTWEGWRGGWHRSRTSQEGDSCPYIIMHQVQNQAETFYGKHSTDLLLYPMGQVAKWWRKSVHFPFWWEWGWISNRDPTFRQQSMHTAQRNRQTLRYTVVKSQK